MGTWRGGGVALVVACGIGCFSETAMSEVGTRGSSTGGEGGSTTTTSTTTSTSTSTTTSTSTSTTTTTGASTSTGVSGSSEDSEGAAATGERCAVTRCETCENCIECRSCALEAVCDDESVGCDEDCQALVACMDTCDGLDPSCYTNCCCAYTLAWQSYNPLASCLEGECQFCGTPSCVTNEC